MVLLIRQARLEDGETLRGMSHIAGFDLAKELRVGGAWAMVALRSEELIGYVLFRGVLGEWDVINRLVAPDYRRRGVARDLMASALEEIGLQGTATVHLDVREGNEAAIALYHGLGFSDSGRRAGYYRKGDEDALLMKRVVRGACPDKGAPFAGG